MWISHLAPLAATLPLRGALLMGGAGVLVYAAARAASDALRPNPESDDRPVVLAVAQWAPVAVVAVLAAATGEPRVAVGVVFGTSVAMLSLNLGLVTSALPPDDLPPEAARVWPFVVPAAVLVLLAGFAAEFTLVHAAMFLILGAAIATAARTTSRRLPPGGFEVGPLAASPSPALNWVAAEAGTTAATAGTTARAKEAAEVAGEFPSLTNRGRPPRGLTVAGVVQVVLAAGVAGVGGWMGIRSARASEGVGVATAGLVSATVLSPLLTLPMIGAGSEAARQGRPGRAVAALVTGVLLNLCLLLPAVIAVAHGRRAYAARTAADPAAADALRAAPALLYPLPVWRIDAVAILLLATLLIPVAHGRWTLGRREGLALVAGYVAYLYAVVYLAHA